MRMYLDVACINHEPLVIGRLDQLLKQAFPCPAIAPPAEATVSVLPVSIAGWQISPRRSCTQYPEHGVKKLPIVATYAAPLPATSRKMRLKQRPSGV